MRIQLSLVVIPLAWSLAWSSSLAWPLLAHADELASSAQPPRLRAGVALGLNLSNTLGNECTASCDLMDFDPQASFKTGDQLSAGAYVLYRLDPTYTLRVEARLTMKGVKATHVAGATVFQDDGTGQMVPQDVGLLYTLEHTMRYVQVPVLVQRDIPYDNVFRPHVLAGLGLGYLVSASADGSGQVIDAGNAQLGTLSGTADPDDVAAPFDLSAIVGAGMVFPMRRGGLEIGVRYEFSVLSALDGLFLSSIESDVPLYAPGATTPDPAAQVDNAPLMAENMRHHLVSVVLGYQF